MFVSAQAAIRFPLWLLMPLQILVPLLSVFQLAAVGDVAGWRKGGTPASGIGARGTLVLQSVPLKRALAIA